MHKYCLFLISFEFDYLLKEALGGKPFDDRFGSAHAL
jgi:hypothetical protein